MKKIAKVKLLLCGIMLLLFCPLAGCIYEKNDYAGEHPELFTIAMNSILGANGWVYVSPTIKQPLLEVMEEDSYGRKMFVYCETPCPEDNGLGESYYLFISQFSDENYAYFYTDYNFIRANGSGYPHSKEKWYVLEPMGLFSDDGVKSLKNKNDWNKEINYDQCMKAEIIYKKDENIDRSNKKTIMKLYHSQVGNRHAFKSASYLTSDNYGRMIYTASGASGKFVFIFNPDWSYNEDTYAMKRINFDCQDELKEHKELNNWNQPF